MGFNEIKEWISEDWTVIKSAPRAFFGALGMVTVLVAFGINYLKANQIEDLNSRIALRDDAIADYKRKLEGASPEEARAVIDDLRKRVDALSPRTLSAKQRQAIVEAASPGEARGLTIISDVGASDAQGLARGFAHAFQTAGWYVKTPIAFGPSYSPPSGIGLIVQNPANLSRDERQIAESLKAAGVRFDIERGVVPEAIPSEIGLPVSVAQIVVTNRLSN